MTLGTNKGFKSIKNKRDKSSGHKPMEKMSNVSVISFPIIKYLL